VAGNLFADPANATNDDVETISSLIDGKINVPLTTYFTLGSHPLPDKVAFKVDENAGELCSNLFFLGKRATTKTSDGVRIVSLGGVLDEHLKGPTNDVHSVTYSEDDAKTLKGATTADILVTSEWPEQIRKGSKVEGVPGKGTWYRQIVADLCAALKPRYHFTVSRNLFYEREPFFHPQENEAESGIFRITRFISLAAFGNSDKQKWIYAFSVDPNAPPAITVPPGITTSPLSVSRKRAPAPAQSNLHFSSEAYSESRPRKRHKGSKRGAPPGPAECFFCLSNPNVATHLITSIGNDAYMTTAKGPLTTSTTFSNLEFPAHLLIIPLVHSPTLAAIEDSESKMAALKEMRLYRMALNNMLKSKDKSLASVTWSISRSGGVHYHWQWLPVSSTLVTKGLVDAAFKVEAENQKYPAFEMAETGDEEAEDEFRVTTWVPETGKEVVLSLPLDSSYRFDLQFGRRVLAKLLEVGGRADWRDCGQDMEDEEKDVMNFKNAFKEFDFSLEE